jgi:hypothetical protein
MVDPKHDDGGRLVIDLVDDSIRPTSGRPQAGKFASQRVTNSARVLTQRADHELDDRCSDSFG